MCNPPSDTLTCMWKFQSISESSQPKNWMRCEHEENAVMHLSCIPFVPGGETRGYCWRTAGERNWRHSAFSWDGQCMRIQSGQTAKDSSCLSLILVLTSYACLTWIYFCHSGRPWYNKMAATQFKNFLYAFCGKRKTRPVYTERPSKPGSFSFQARKNFPFSVYFPLRIRKNYFYGSWRFHV